MEYQEEKPGRSRLILTFNKKMILKKGDLNHFKMTAKLLCTSETAML